MGLLEFLFENPLIIILLIGALSTLFGKKKQEEQKQRQQRQQQQRQQQANTNRQEADTQYDEVQTVELPWEQYPEELEQPMYKTESSPSSRENRDRDSRSRSRNESRYEQVDNHASVASTAVDRGVERLHVRENRIRDQIDASRNQIEEVIYSEDVNQLMDFKRINSQNIVQGVIWAEVLGAPKARNPHRSQGYLYRQRRLR
ncbi:hypothetical protein [Bacillus horti]|uniref:Type II secretory pathway pseudopilin PulG n=1 Tax=Caldalkalibacillus horti TaxID=77523 RepID=A0ABT9W4P8_9BACI|nr:hypothetical protein [Bacillus horti]MDQ0168047.1 type II secretory pathway pseudopilin PulG [Bacillus horti]